VGPSVQSCGVVLRYDLGRRRDVLERADNVGIEIWMSMSNSRVGEDGAMALEEGLTAAALHYLLLRAIAGQRQLQYK
jgi:hypothetical protein